MSAIDIVNISRVSNGLLVRVSGDNGTMTYAIEVMTPATADARTTEREAELFEDVLRRGLRLYVDEMANSPSF